MEYCCMNIKIVKLKNNTNYVKNEEKLEYFYIAGNNVKWYNYSRKAYNISLQN